MESTGRGRYQRTPRIYSIEGLPIDNEATFAEFGYYAVNLSPTAQKKVICWCTKCNRKYVRLRSRVYEGYVCSSCSRAKKTEFREFTHREGLQKVEAVCAMCGKTFLIRLKSKREGNQCRACIRSNHTVSNNPHINDELTKEKYGYTQKELSVKSHDKVVVACAECGSFFDRVRRNVKDKPVCSKCARSKIKWDTEKRRRTIFERYGEGGIVVNQECCGKVEREVKDWLEEITGREFLAQVPLPDGRYVDMVDPETKIGLEYCGLYWHNEGSPTPRGRNYHYSKMIACEREGIRLITLFEDEWRDKKQAVKNLLSAAFNALEHKVYARNCTCAELSSADANEFLEREHVQGKGKTPIYSCGIFNKSTLIGVLTAAEHHRKSSKNELVLSRLCFSSGIRVVGGAGKLFSRLVKFADVNKYGCIISWSDNRFFDGSVYPALGFSLDTQLRPDYMYVKKKRNWVRLSKQSQKKSRTGCPEGMTELQWANENGLSRIWDCGKRRWLFELSA